MQNIIKNVRSFFTSKEGQKGKTLVTELELEYIDKAIAYSTVDDLRKEIVNRIAELFLEESGQTLKKQILNNPNFADAVYNAIVLKTANKID